MTSHSHVSCIQKALLPLGIWTPPHFQGPCDCSLPGEPARCPAKKQPAKGQGQSPSPTKGLCTHAGAATACVWSPGHVGLLPSIPSQIPWRLPPLAQGTPLCRSAALPSPPSEASPVQRAHAELRRLSSFSSVLVPAPTNEEAETQ